jgi:hypothetical protein
MRNRIAFEPFVKLDLSKPVKLIPEGLWHRGDRKMDITANRLREMARNFKEGLPNYRPPVNLNHEENDGKVGNIIGAKYMEEGADGPGLYVDIELTDKGRKKAEEDGYDGVSAEIAWSLNGSHYQNPKDGKKHDNVLVGMALTPLPYFGHGEVSLYTADAERAFEVVEIYRSYGGATTFDDYDEWVEAQKLESDVYMTTAVLRELIENVLNDDGIEDKGTAISTLANEFQNRISQAGSDEMGFIDRIRKAVNWTSPELTESTSTKEGLSMTEENVTIEEEVIEEELETQEETQEETLEAETPSVEQLAGELEASNKRADKLEADLNTERMTRRRADLAQVAAAYEALPIEVDEYVDKMIEIEDTDSEIAGWLAEKFAAIDKAMVEAGLLREIGSDLEANLTGVNRFTALIDAKLKESFDGDKAKYSEALEAVSAEHPKLAQEYSASIQ